MITTASTASPAAIALVPPLHRLYATRSWISCVNTVGPRLQRAAFHSPRTATKTRPTPYSRKKPVVVRPSTSRELSTVKAWAIPRTMSTRPSTATTAAASLSGLGTAATGESVGTSPAYGSPSGDARTQALQGFEVLRNQKLVGTVTCSERVLADGPLRPI